MEGLTLVVDHVPHVDNVVHLRTKRYRTCAEVKAAVARRYGITVADLESSSRAWKYAHPRQLAMALCAKLLRPRGYSYPMIARAFGNRDHTTVIYACRKWGIKADPRIMEARREGIERRLALPESGVVPARSADDAMAFLRIAARFHSLPVREVIS